MAGSLDEAVEVGRFIQGRADELNLQSYAGYAYSPALIAAQHLGKIEVLEELRAPDPYVLALRGRKEELGLIAETWLKEAASPAESTMPLATLALRLQMATILGHERTVAAYMQPLKSSPRPAMTPAPLCISRLLGDGALLTGDFVTAKGYFLEAIEVATQMHHRPEVALARLGLAEAMIRDPRGDKRAARYELDLAISEFEAMGMQPALERAMLLQSGRPAVEPREPAYPGGLSSREVEVLRLLAAGRSNQQIANELVISLNTVRRHVSNIFDKTGAANRVEAATFARDHGIA
jgi:DNA-binding CsgD family transcriptional regulator